MSTPRPRRPAVALGLGAVLGALIWGAWLGWDRTPSYDVVTGTVQTPYVTLQVAGCALTVGLVTAVLAGRWHPVAAAAGIAVGFWLVWTVHAASGDATGLYAVGSVMLAIGLAGEHGRGSGRRGGRGRGSGHAPSPRRGRRQRAAGARPGLTTRPAAASCTALRGW